MTRLCTGL